MDVSSIGQKKFYFFLPKTIWRFHQVVPAPLLSSDKSFLSCSSYLCSEKISSKFHSISISSWLWTRITLIISRSFSVSNFWIPKKSFSFILSESSFCSRSFLLFSASSIFRFIYIKGVWLPPDPHFRPSSLPLIKDPHKELSTTMLVFIVKSSRKPLNKFGKPSRTLIILY